MVFGGSLKSIRTATAPCRSLTGTVVVRICGLVRAACLNIQVLLFALCRTPRGVLPCQAFVPLAPLVPPPVE